MTDLTKIKISMILGSARFWVIVIVIYLLTKNFTEQQIFQIIGLYYIASTIFEYPTGVVGDYFSHRTSVIWGYFTVAFALVFLTFAISLWQVTLFYIVYALGAALLSGSDTALLHSASRDFKHDMSQVKIFSTLVSAAALSIGGWLGTIDLRYPFYLNFLFFSAAIIFLLFVKKQDHDRIPGNIFATAKEGLKQTLSHNHLFHLMVVSCLTSALYFNFKWFYNPLFLELNIDLKYWGILGGISLLLVALGAFMYKKISEKNIYVGISILAISLLFMGMTSFSIISIAGLFLAHLARGFLGTKITVDMNKVINTRVRASVLSLESLLVRIGSSIIVFISGYLLEAYSFAVLIYALLIIIIIGSFYSLNKIRKFESN